MCVAVTVTLFIDIHGIFHSTEFDLSEKSVHQYPSAGYHELNFRSNTIFELFRLHREFSHACHAYQLGSN